MLVLGTYKNVPRAEPQSAGSDEDSEPHGPVDHGSGDRSPCLLAIVDRALGSRDYTRSIHR
jgi:hypothetical protein